MITDIDKYVSFLTEHQLTEHQFLILWLVHTKDRENITKYKNTFKQFTIEQVIDLIERGWIDDFGTIKDNKIEFNIYNYIVTDKFSKEVLVDDEDAYEELVKVYPKFMEVKGTKWPMIKGDPELNAKIYRKYHKGNKILHQEAVDITEKYFKKNPVTSNIQDYIQNRRWLLYKDELINTKKDAFETL